ncbi:cobaltochelatase subunit CobN [Streptomyces nogalater]
MPSRTRAVPLPLYVASLRAPEPELITELRAADAIVTTVLAAGGTKPAEASAGGDDESWDAGALTTLDVPILQALCLTGSRTAWAENDEGVSRWTRPARSRSPNSTAV